MFVRIFDYFDRPNIIMSKPDAVSPDFSHAEIVFKEVNFAYNRNVPLLKNVSFRVPNGEMHAIVGPSGSGKSTIVNLIPRLYDVDSGSVEICGVDVRDIELEHLCKSIGFVTQDTYLHNGTIKENLLYANDSASDEEIMNACRISNLHDFIKAQPDRYDTIVGNRARSKRKRSGLLKK